MLYTKIQPQSLCSGEKDFKCCYHILSLPFDRRPHVKSGDNWSSGFTGEGVLRLEDFIHVYSPRTRADNLKGTE